MYHADVTRRTFLRLAGGALGLGAGVGSFARFIEPQWVEFTTPVPAGAAAPRFAMISDLHLRSLSDMHQEIADEVRRRAPDYVVFPGDSVDHHGKLPLLDEFLGALPAVPKFAILGNWEHWARIPVDRLRAVYERHDGRLLVNETLVHDGVVLTGLDDLVAGRPDLSAALRDAPDGAQRLLLAHCPAQRDLLGAAARSRFDMILSGHTHGGQVRPFGWAPFRPRGSGRYLAGWYRTGGVPLYVSRGVGTSVLPVRLGARPEVAFFG